jgi:hypothetical protein
VASTSGPWRGRSAARPNLRTRGAAIIGISAPNRPLERTPSPADALAVCPDDRRRAGGPLLVPVGTLPGLPDQRSTCVRSIAAPTLPWRASSPHCHAVHAALIRLSQSSCRCSRLAGSTGADCEMDQGVQSRSASIISLRKIIAFTKRTQFGRAIILMKTDSILAEAVTRLGVAIALVVECWPRQLPVSASSRFAGGARRSLVSLQTCGVGELTLAQSGHSLFL